MRGLKLFVYAIRLIRMLSIIAAIINNGMMMVRKTRNDLYVRLFSSLYAFFENKNSPSFSPRARAMNIAGSSKIPCGIKRSITDGPCTSEAIAKT